MDCIQTPSACIMAEPGSIAKTVLFPGDPLRAKALAEKYLENAECFNTVRNMLGYTGTYRGRRISVMGSGMGIPSATIYAHELYNIFGVENIIRIGTAGGIADDIKLRDVVIALTASTNSHFADQYCFPGQLSPCAAWPLASAAIAAAEGRSLSARVGQVFTADMFYNVSPGINEKCRDMGILAIDMETAGIYWEAMASGKNALSILTVSNHIFTGEEAPAAERETAFFDMMDIALDTAWQFSD